MPQNPPVVQRPMHTQPTFQHINATASASPPIANGVPYHPRHGTPQPGGVSRPSSRNNIQRINSNLVPPHHHAHGTPPPRNGYPYIPNPAIYNHQANQNIPPQHPRPGQFPYAHPPPIAQPPPHAPMHVSQASHHQPIAQHQHPPLPPPPPQHMAHQLPHPQQHLPPPPPPPPHSQHSTPQPHHQPFSQVQQAYLQEQRRAQSVPPFQPQQPQIPPSNQSPPTQQGQPKSEEKQSPPAPKPLPSKSRSIFTPIDDRGSVLAQHFGFGPPAESPKAESAVKTEPDSAETTSHSTSLPPPPPPPAMTHAARAATHPQRTQSISSMPDVTPISRSSSLQVGAKRPRLKVQIPSENSDGGSGTADSSPKDSGQTAATPAKGSETGGHSAVVLPPPSPSASALLSAGAQGPPNPFARPPPPGTAVAAAAAAAASQNNAAYSNNSNNIETPISALPSRFVSDTLLPSPSSFYPEWGFGRSGPDSNMLPSPLAFPTPTAPNAPAFNSGNNNNNNNGNNNRELDDAERKRKSPDANNNTQDGKRLRVD